MPLATSYGVVRQDWPSTVLPSGKVILIAAGVLAVKNKNIINYHMPDDVR